jgi:hypothetical protein
LADLEMIWRCGVDRTRSRITARHKITTNRCQSGCNSRHRPPP